MSITAHGVPCCGAGKSAKHCQWQSKRADFEEAAGELPAKAGKATNAATVGRTPAATASPGVKPKEILSFRKKK